MVEYHDLSSSNSIVIMINIYIALFFELTQSALVNICTFLKIKYRNAAILDISRTVDLYSYLFDLCGQWSLSRREWTIRHSRSWSRTHKQTTENMSS